jgi:nucleotide-binding universal stress UspA family protein
MSMKNYRIKNILVPLDFSALSLHAVNHAERIARLIRARITLLHVVEPFGDAVGTSGMLATAMRLERELQIQSAKRLQKIARTAMQTTKGQIDTAAIIGPIASTITRAATETKANLIIMGTHGASGFVENLVGSNTYRVATLSRIPVLSVHKPVERSGYSNLIYPVRGKAGAIEKFPYALTFARLFNARVHVVGHLPAGNKQQAEKIRALCVLIEKKFAGLGLATKRAFTTSDEFAEAIIRYANVYSGSLVVILQDYDFRLVEVFKRSFTKKMLHKVLSPVLTVPSRK